MEDKTSVPVLSGDPVAEARAFRKCLGAFATGVTVVTAEVTGQLVGVTANSFSSVSLDPPLILWSLAHTSTSLEAFRSASHFAVNILALDQTPLANRFARSGPDKFVGVGWQQTRFGSPAFPGIAALLECRTHAQHELGDHTLFIGHVEQFSQFDRRPLLFVNGQFGLAGSHPDSRTQESETRDLSTTSVANSRLLRGALLGYSEAFRAHREAEGLHFNQSHVLFAIVRYPRSSIESIARESFLSTEETRDTASELEALGYLERAADGALVATPAGLDKYQSLRARHVAFEAQLYAEIPSDEMEIFRRILKHLMTARTEANRQP